MNGERRDVARKRNMSTRHLWALSYHVFLSIILVGLLTLVIPVSVVKADSLATFPDPSLRGAIRAAINKPTGDIYQSDLDALTALIADGLDIADLTGLQYCTSLTALYLGNNQINDISPLAGLTSLTSLRIYENQISNISPLSGLSSLTSLRIYSNQIGDISPLAGLSSLTSLSIYSNQISDISPLAGLISLTTLYLGVNQISDISPLAGLTNLTMLNLHDNQISDIKPLVDNPWIASGDTVYLNTNPLSSTSVDAHIPALEARGVEVYWTETSFPTLPPAPLVTTGVANSITTTSATLNGYLTSLGMADSVTLSFVWGTTTGLYTGETPEQVRDSTGAYYLYLTSLTSGTTYYYKAKAVGDGDRVYGEEKNFTTIDVTAPVISLLKSQNITPSRATITWTTNEAATTQVEYGLAIAYGSSTTLDTNLATSHNVKLTGLSDSTVYHYRVISKDASNNQTVSGDQTFTTAARSGGMPIWAWIIIGVAGIGIVGTAAHLISKKSAK
jgi:hypothetical protein